MPAFGGVVYGTDTGLNIDIILRVPGLETVYWALASCSYYGAVFCKTSIYWSLPSNKSIYTTMADKEMTFCTIFVSGYLRNAMVYPQIEVDPP